MTVQYIGVNRGGRLADVATGTSSPGKDIEIAIDLSKGITRAELLQAMEGALSQFVTNTRTTPFAQ